MFREIRRVLRPGGDLLASDGYDNEGTRAAHLDDVFVPLDSRSLPDRLETLGFTGIVVDRGPYDFRFVARMPREPGRP